MLFNWPHGTIREFIKVSKSVSQIWTYIWSHICELLFLGRFTLKSVKLFTFHKKQLVSEKNKLGAEFEKLWHMQREFERDTIPAIIFSYF